MDAFTKVRASEAARKEALRSYCAQHGWRVAFFEGKTGAARTGIIDTIVFRANRKSRDRLDLRLVQLGVFPKMGRRQYFRDEAGSIQVDIRAAGESSACCGVNLAFGVFGIRGRLSQNGPETVPPG